MNLTRFTLAVLFLSLIYGCAPGPSLTVTEPGAPAEKIEQAAQILFENGKYLESAMEYAKLAEAADPDEKPGYQLNMAKAFVSGNYLPQAKQLLDEIALPTDNSIQRIEKELLWSQTYLSDQQADKSLKHLAAIDNIQLASQQQKKRFYLLAARTQEQLGKHVNAANGYISLSEHLTNKAALQKNRYSIWDNLQHLDKSTLQQLVKETTSKPHAGWYALALYGKTGLTQERAIKQKADEWLNQYADHLSKAEAIELLGRTSAIQGHPKQIALLLPLSNQLAAPAKAVRDGFLAAYYAHANNAASTIRIYDSGDSNTPIEALYQQAVDDGAEFVVGPLDKSQVNRLIDQGDIDVPTMVLNYADSENSVKQLYQFGLSPEHEARQVAERAWMNGHRYALALIPEGTWGERIYEAFRSRFEEFGGIIDEHQLYSPKNHDFSAPIKTLLNIDESNQRKQALGKAIQTRLVFSPRRRQDVDFIFMAAFPRQAHQIPPQLQFHHAADIPVYTTSHAFSGHSTPKKDRDLNGVTMGDTPWVLNNSPLRKQIKKLFPAEESRFTRLFALGVDAFNLIPHIQRLETDITESYSGTTGHLRIYENRQLYRQLTWAVFSGGRPLNQGM